MSTIREMQMDISNKLTLIRREGNSAIETKLTELGLGGLVKRKRDGKIGKLRVWAYNDIRFFPFRKDGTLSARTDGFVSRVEEEYEPYND